MGQIAQATQGRQLTQLNPTQQMKRLLEKSWSRIAAVMPREMSEQRLYQMYVSTINREPALAQCSVESVLSCFMRCTSLGLEPSNVNGLGYAYILPFGNKNMRTGQKEATFILGYKGIIELARRSGQIRDISARAVHEGDEFTYEYGLHEDLRHIPCDKPGKLTHVYMVAHYKDGGHLMQVMNLDEINAAMRRSPSANRSTSPWKSDFEAMAKKTVIRRAAPFLPLSVETKTAVTQDEQTPDYSDLLKPVIPAVDDMDADDADMVDVPSTGETPADDADAQSSDVPPLDYDDLPDEPDMEGEQ
ncbi:DNA binding, phage related protein [Bifidobacterium ramosum]|uniref:DNA binding, phage related protein n=1 Tax=Bifidobacterium ramosum TaxID=1798158 RepID=A0A6L4X3M1_9BIFI|nr:recombinase RecT [Bifidobacterium ramosum]KAB8289336.1 DNA binding, phage related protein [Bifidobacterium ramosum]NEG71034.1 DNA-binding protein [Bifidobacterium ramosum]